MINTLQISNFKCFQESIPFEFAGLNLLTGINGRGKSSIFQSILLLSQSFDGHVIKNKINLNGKHINLGNYDDVKNSETPRSESIMFKMKVANSINASFQFKENENDELTALIEKCDVLIEKDDNIVKINSIFEEIASDIESKLGNEQGKSKVNLDFSRIAFNEIIKRIHYVSADRLGPVKYVDKASFGNLDFMTVGSKGEFTINVLAKPDIPLVNEKLYLGSDSSSVLQQTEEWLGYILEGAKLKIEGLEKTSSVLWMLINNKSNSYKYKPTNVGFGYSYVLPLIVSGLIAQEGDVLIVENPEAHLHPRAQSRIAEFFSKVASCGVQVFIESHSEHILNGLRVSILNPEIEIKKEDLVIHYFNETFIPEKLSIDENGKIENWPNGFFDQQEIDLANIFKFSR